MKFSSLSAHIEQKILRNNLLIQIFELEQKIAKAEMVIRLRILKHNENNIKTLSSINSLEKEQQMEFSIDREYKIRELIYEINTKRVDIEELNKEVDENNKKIQDLFKQINSINLNIPIAKLVINYDTDIGLTEIQKKCNY